MAQVEKIDAGPKGATIAFRNNTFPNPSGLVRLITEHHRQNARAARSEGRSSCATGRRRKTRLKGAEAVLGQLALMAEAVPA